MKILILITLILLILLLSNIKIYFYYDGIYKIKIKFLVFTVFKFDKERKVKSEKSVQNISDISEPERETKKLKNITCKVKKTFLELMKFTKKSMKIDNLKISYRFGFNDAAFTGVYSGVAYGIIYSLIGYIDNNTLLKKKDIILTPDFDNEIQELYLEFSVKMRLYSLILSGIKIFRLWIK